MKIISNHIVEAIALITAVWNYRYIKNTRYVYFIPVLAFILLGELGGVYFANPPNLSVAKNSHIYLSLAMVQFIFYGYMFYQIIHSKRMKQIIFIGTSVILLLLAIWLFFFDKISVPLTITNGVAGFFFSCVSCFYLYEKSITPTQTEESLFGNPDFWFAIGILIFRVTATIPFLLYFFLSKNQILFLGKPLYHFFPQVFSVVLYGCFTIAIILWRKKAIIYYAQSQHH